MHGQIETRVRFVWMDAEGIVHSMSKPDVHVSLADMREVARQIGRLCDGTPRPLLVDLNGTSSMDREARAYLAGPETAHIQCAKAVMVCSPLARAIGNFFVRLNETIVPTRLFTAEEPALGWLRGFLS